MPIFVFLRNRYRPQRIAAVKTMMMNIIERDIERPDRDRDTVVRALDALPRIAPDHGGAVLEDIDEPDGEEYLVEFAGAEDRTETEPFDHRTYSDEGKHGQEDDKIGIDAGEEKNGCGDIGTDHEELAMREIDDLHDPEDKVQAGCEQDIDAAGIQSPEDDLQEYPKLSMI